MRDRLCKYRGKRISHLLTLCYWEQDYCLSYREEDSRMSCHRDSQLGIEMVARIKWEQEVMRKVEIREIDRRTEVRMGKLRRLRPGKGSIFRENSSGSRIQPAGKHWQELLSPCTRASTP